MDKSVDKLLEPSKEGGKVEIRKVRLVGNSLHVAIPEKMLQFVGIAKNNYVKVEVYENGIYISAVDVRKGEVRGGKQ